jgi:oxygen-independent coproporphyrinogen III oxidase
MRPQADTGGSPVALYVHVPFCKSRCSYCDFTSSSEPFSGVTIDGYLAGVERSLRTYGEAGLLKQVPSIYFGGGTPTVLGTALPKLVALVLDHATLATGAEVTVEANPESLNAELLDALVSSGINRVSLGVQSFDDATLALLGRCHDASAARAAASLLADSGVDFSIDLICGVPGLTNDCWLETVAEAITSGAEHVSVYPLSIEEGTPLGRLVDAGQLDEPDEDAAADQMLAAARLLEEAGFERYEVASYARPGRRARHNSVYWSGGAYLGIGPSAASMLPGSLAVKVPALRDAADGGDSRIRYVMHEELASFVDREDELHAPSFVETLTGEDATREDAMLGLRLSDGISDDLAGEAGIGVALAQLELEGLVVHVSGHWRVTERGWLLGNEVFSRVL